MDFQEPEFQMRELRKPIIVRHTVNSDAITSGLVFGYMGIGLITVMAILLQNDTALNCTLVKAIGAVGLVLGILLLPLSVFLLYMKSRTPKGQEMQLVLRIILNIVAFIFFLILLAIGAAGVAALTFANTKTELRRDYTVVAGTIGDIHIYRDKKGMPNIRALTHHDALFGQGFVQAQDRLAQLELQRLFAYGRLSEFIGNETLEDDIYARAMGFKQAGARLCNNLDAATTSAVHAFVSGINFYLDNEPQLPPEFMVLGKPILSFHKPEPFTVADICVIGRLLMWSVSTNMGREMTRWQMFMYSGKSYSEIEDLFPHYPRDDEFTIVTRADMGITDQMVSDDRARIATDNAYEKQLYDDFFSLIRQQWGPPSGIPGVTTFGKSTSGEAFAQTLRRSPPSKWHGMPVMDSASNSWVGTAGGSQPPVVSNDPHLRIRNPSVWHYSHVEYAGFSYSGVTMPGLPGLVIGRNSFVSWGATMAMTDLQDMYYIQTDPASPVTHYLHNGVSKAFSIRTETIKVRNKGDVTLPVSETVYGPVLTGALQLPPGLQLAFKSVALEDDDTTLAAIVRLTTPAVNSVTALRDNVFAHLKAPALSLALGDIHGSYGYAMTGHHPLRAVGHTGKYPTLGNGTFDDRGVIPYTALPTKVVHGNQPGFILAANQRMYPIGYGYTLGDDFYPAHRGQRISERLGQMAAAGELSDINTHLGLLMDEQSNIWAYMYRPIIYGSGSVGVAFRGMLDSEGTAWLERLRQWDMKCSRGSTECAFFWQWQLHMSGAPRDILLGPTRWDQQYTDNLDYEDYWQEKQYFGPKLLLNDTTSFLRYCNGDCIRYAADGWNQVARSAPKIWGEDFNRFTLRHTMFDDTLLECIFNRESSKGGDGSSVNVASSHAFDSKIEVSHAASMRMLMPMDANIKYMYFGLPGGPSGNPFSAYYDSLVDDYSANILWRIQLEQDFATCNGVGSVGCEYPDRQVLQKG